VGTMYNASPRLRVRSFTDGRQAGRQTGTAGRNFSPSQCLDWLESRRNSNRLTSIAEVLLTSYWWPGYKFRNIPRTASSMLQGIRNTEFPQICAHTIARSPLLSHHQNTHNCEDDVVIGSLRIRKRRQRIECTARH